MTQKEFFKRRLIRLHPMVVMGVRFGCYHILHTRLRAVGRYPCFHINGNGGYASQSFPDSGCSGHGSRGPWKRRDVPLNGPSWSLFFEYIGNILYALFIRRLSTKALTILVVIAGIGLASFSIFNLSGNYHLGVAGR